jgi:hypothetical protein
MTRTWSELLGEPEIPAEAAEERRGFISRLRDSLGKSRKALVGQIAAAAFDPGDDLAWVGPRPPSWCGDWKRGWRYSIWARRWPRRSPC